MFEFHDLQRNVTFWEGYDENSFIGKWVDDGIWSDKEYWKLENDLLRIKKKHPYPKDIPREIVAGIFRINELLMVSNWTLFEIESSPWLSDEVNIYDRFERFKVMVRCLFLGENIENSSFYYYYKEEKI